MRYLSLLLLVAVALTACSGDSSTSTTTENGDAAAPPAQFVKQTIDAPIPAADLPMQSLSVDAARGGQLTLPSGTAIDVPAGAFVYADGRPVTGNVTVNFREFHTAAEVILSGIPMRDWDDATQSWQNFSTAGMFELRGTDAAGTEVEIAHDRALDVHLVSATDGTYQSWYFDEDKGDWDQVGDNTAEPFDPPAATATPRVTNRRPPVPPVAYDPAAIRMDFAGMNLDDFPELSDPDRVALQYAGRAGAESDPAQNAWIFSTNWYKAELTNAGRPGQYRLYLENDDATFTTQVRATLLPEAYEEAVAEYRRQTTVYEAEMREAGTTQSRSASSFRRSMPVSQFGVYNYDVYSSWQEPIFAQTQFNAGDETGVGSIKQVYLLTDDGKITVRYPKSYWQRFNFDRNRKNLLLGITSDARIVMVAPETFSRQSADLAARSRTQTWDCVMDGEVVAATDAAELQRRIDRYFAS